MLTYSNKILFRSKISFYYFINKLIYAKLFNNFNYYNLWEI